MTRLPNRLTETAMRRLVSSGALDGAVSADSALERIRDRREACWLWFVCGLATGFALAAGLFGWWLL